MLNSDFGHLWQWKRKSLELSIHCLHIFKAFWLIARQPGFKQNRICPKLRSQQRHVTIHSDKKVDTLAAFLEVRLVLPKGNRTVWTRECPTWSYLKKRKKNGIEKVFRVKVGEGEGLPFENDGDTPIFLSIKVSLRVVGKKKSI